MSENATRVALIELAKRIQLHEDWWIFPEENSVKGFMGMGPVFIVGDQPSTDPWPPEHPNRRVFYNTLQKAGLAGAHLTDLYKRRGLSSALEHGLPSDFSDHVSLFQEEIKLLQPTLIVALGQLAQRLLIENVRFWKRSVPRIWHFSHVVRVGKEIEYESNMREMIVLEP